MTFSSFTFCGSWSVSISKTSHNFSLEICREICSMCFVRFVSSSFNISHHNFFTLPRISSSIRANSNTHRVNASSSLTPPTTAFSSSA